MDNFSFVPTTPIQRRLTKIYTDTKNIYDFIKEPVKEEDPELTTLHRKLKIQKDRLVAWGLEWSDSSRSPDIDESIAKAGLSELVGSVMSTIKEILAEAEPLWQSSREDGNNDVDVSRDSKRPIMLWDKCRFEDLIRDLTMSIDTLFNLSKTRQSNRQFMTSKSKVSKASKKAVEEKQFQSSRMSTPQQIDPKAIIFPGQLKSLTNGPGIGDSSRQIVFMRRPNPADSIKPGALSAVVPVLLEYAPYEPIYSITGIPPPMSRFEKLFAGLSQASISSNRAMSGLLPVIGYYEEPENSRFCLLFSLPSTFGPVDIESPALKLPVILTLADLLVTSLEPSLEVRYRLASNIANAVFDLHAKGAVHGNLVSSNIILFQPPVDSSDPINQCGINLRQSYLASFDLFSENAANSSGSPSPQSFLNRHSLDPRITRYTHLTSESKSLDLYGLAILLLQVGMWCPLLNLFFDVKTIPEQPIEKFQQLSSRCGSVFTKAVQACWNAPEAEISKKARPDVMHQKVFWRVSKALAACCAIDEVSDSEVSESDEIPPAASARWISQLSTPKNSSSLGRNGPTTFPTAPRENDVTIDWSEKPVLKPKFPTRDQIVEWTRNTAAATATGRTKPKFRTYPSIGISQEHLHFWHTGLMPHINRVLRGFYRKYPESVEISLESIGETSSKTKPTILVICTSVNKVRSILKKSLVYDNTIFGLKVCQGKVVRSRKHGNRGSLEHNTNIQAINIAHQDQPCRGASIGAYVGEKHLPPVSFGGTILIDDEPYGMTVHHMLEDPSDSSDEESEGLEPIPRSSVQVTARAYLEIPSLTHSSSTACLSGDELYSYPLSDCGSSTQVSDSETYSDFDVSDDGTGFQPGDRRGIIRDKIAPDDYLVTQPALDDVPGDFYPSDETRDEDHLDSFTLGSVYCSSGIRRRASSNIMHEIDWALFNFVPERLPTISATTTTKALIRNHELPGMNVCSVGRTTGHKKGRIQESMSVVKMAGRCTPSASWTVIGGMGVPGDSGAWVVLNSAPQLPLTAEKYPRVAGTILAYSSRKACAYICPMDIAITDIAETIGATKISLPGGGILYDALSSPASTPTRLHTWNNVEDKISDDANPCVDRIGGQIRPGLQVKHTHSKDELEARDNKYIVSSSTSQSRRDRRRCITTADEYTISDLSSDPTSSPCLSAVEEEASSTLHGPFAPSIPVSFLGSLPDQVSSASAPERWGFSKDFKDLNLSNRSSRPPVFNFNDLVEAGVENMLGSLDLGKAPSPPGDAKRSMGNELNVGMAEEVVSRG